MNPVLSTSCIALRSAKSAAGRLTPLATLRIARSLTCSGLSRGQWVTKTKVVMIRS
jgi:hypothetical protein